ncbi:MAG: helix-turn-helix domain-containing protein [bacterium]
MDKYLTVDEVADILRVTRGTIYRLIKQGKIPFVKFGKRYLFVKNEVLNLLIR